MDFGKRKGRSKKLIEAATLWASGGSSSDYEKSSSALGVEPDRKEPEIFEIWPENFTSWEIFLKAAREWEWISGMAAFRTNLKGVLIWELIDRHPDAPRGRREKWKIFEQVTLMEQSALAVFSEQSSV